MERGSLIADRFEIVSLAGTGGMGSVYKALDRQSGKHVALKVMRELSDEERRFRHEARVLAALSHPHVVPFAAYGVGPEGRPYIAMEWIEGESLAARLEREGLSIAETLALSRAVASALSAVHQHGVVHRDLKPSNLMLPGGDAARVKLVDFGTARLSGFDTAVTRSGVILGTPGYMAPEQARGDSDVGPAADVFSLGCILFECLAGRPAFEGTRPMALLAKLLLEDPPSLADVRSGLPASLVALVDRMLTKDPAARPAHGDVVLRALVSLEPAELDRIPEASQPAAPHSLTSFEQRLVAIVAIGAPHSASGTGTGHGSGRGFADTVPISVRNELILAVRNAVEPRGGRVEVLPDGTSLVVLVGGGSPMDQAAQAARSALQIRSLMPTEPVALVMGRGEADRRLPVGEALERVVVLLGVASDRAADGSVVIDDLTRALLDARFDVGGTDGLAVLKGMRSLGDEPRLLLRRPTPFVGRERVLGNLLASIDDAFEEPRATALLVTGAAGMGKSRVRQELLRVVRGRRSTVFTLMGRGDVIAAGSPFATLGSALRDAFDLEGGEDAEVLRDKLLRGVDILLGAQAMEEPAETDTNSPSRRENTLRVAGFLGEVVGVPFPDENNPRLRAARRDAKLMGAQIEAALVELLGRVLRSRPVMLVFEDLHWGDVASVRIVDAALRALSEEPFVVLAFARPEVRERFPRLWSGRQAQEILLQPLSRRAGMELTRAALGDRVSEAELTEIVERSEGNAFFLEELIRAVAEGRGEGLPKTVLGMVEARLSRLDPEVRRAMRAASIFGAVCWKNGVRALLGEASARTDELLSALFERELLVRSDMRRFAGEQEYAFRHELLREAAYSMLTERDRRLGHKLAGEWLEQTGEMNPAVLARHFEQGGEGEKAARYYAQAAEQALHGGDYAAALSLIERGLVAGGFGGPETQGDSRRRTQGRARTEIATGLHALRAEAAYWGGNCELALESAQEVLVREPVGTSVYCRALLGAIGGALLLQKPSALRDSMALLEQVEPTPENVVVLAHAYLQLLNAFVLSSGRNTAERFYTRMQEACGPFAAEEPAVAACIEQAHGTWARWGERDPLAALRADMAAKRHFEEVGYRPLELQSEAFVAASLADLGAVDEADRMLRSVLERAPSAGLSPPLLLARNHYAMLRLSLGEIAEAEAFARDTIEECARQGEALLGKAARLVLVEALLDGGDVEAAEEELEKARASGPGARYLDGWTRTLEAFLLLRQGQVVEAARAAEAALTTARIAGVSWPRQGLAVVTHIEAHLAAGDLDQARTAIREARDELSARAERIDDPVYRKSFLEGVRENARIVELARKWLGEGEA